MSSDAQPSFSPPPPVIGRLVRLVLCLLACAGPVAAQGQYTFRVWQAEDGLPVNLVHSIVQAGDGHVWIATAEGIVRFNGIDFFPLETPEDFAISQTGPARLFATGGDVWFANAYGGLLRFEDEHVTVIWRGADDPDAAEPVTQLLDLPEHGLVALKGEDYWRIEGAEVSPVATPGEDLKARFAEDRRDRARRGRIGADGLPGTLADRNDSRWTAGRRGGLSVISPEGVERPVTIPGIGSDFEVTEMLEDRESNIWVATALHGVGLYREDRVEVLTASTGLSRDTVLSILQDSEGEVWIANRNGGIDLIHESGVKPFNLPVDEERPLISALYEDRNGRLWAATRDGPVYRWLGWRFVEQFLGEDEPSEVNAIYQDASGTLWFGGRNGLVRTTDRHVSKVGVEAGFPGGDVTVMSGGTDGELWLGTDEGFVMKDVDGRLRTVGAPADLAYRRVSAIYVEAPGRVWVTTLGSGLFLHDGGEWHRFDREQGLPDSRLTHVIDDGLGHLWLGSTGGIFRASRKDLLARTSDPARPIHWLRMDRSDGLPTRECVSGHNPAGWRFNDGSIWFPTTLGAVRIEPSKTRVNRTPPPVFIRSVGVDGEVIPNPRDTLNAGPGGTRLRFNYHGLNFSAPEKVTYRVRLKGFEEAWREVGNTRMATYDSVPPGDYRFEVLAMNGDGVLSTEPAVLPVSISAHFWNTRAFTIQMLVLAIVLAVGTGWLIARLRMKRRITSLKIRNARETERSRIARDLHDDLGASLTEISLLAGLGAEQAHGSAFQKHLDDLSNRSRAVAQALDGIVWAVNPREDSLGSLIDYIASFGSEFLDHAGISLRNRIPSDLPDQPIDTSLRHSIFMAVREAFNNIAKHSGAGTAWLRVEAKDGALHIVVEDDGRGFDSPMRTGGHGLGNFEERMRACGGTCEVGPRDAGGTSIHFRIPLLALAPTDS